MVRFRICAYIDQKQNKKTYTPGVTNPLKCTVYAEEPYDKKSKRFNKYTHKVNYTETGYVARDYVLYVYDHESWFHSYIFSYYYPSRKVLSIELYFPSNNRVTRNPLVIGFNEEGNRSTYYTYHYLSQKTSGIFSYDATYNNLPQDNKFDSEGLLILLTEQLGLYGPNRRYRLIVELNRRTTEGVDITYPKTGANKGKITVSKQSNKDNKEPQSEELVKYFDKYTHNFKGKETYSGFYMSLGNDTLFLDTQGVYSIRHFESVNVYYPKTNQEKFLIVVLNFTGIKKVFTYTEFEDFLSKPDATVKISSFKKLDEINLFEKLKEENDKIDENVVYLIEKNQEYSYKVEITVGENDLGGEYKKYTHTPKNGYKDKKSLLLYQGKRLLKKVANQFVNLEETIALLFDKVEVYFGNKNPNIPLFIKLSRSQTSIVECYKRLEENNVEYWEQQLIKEDYNTYELTEILKKEESNLFDPLYLLIDKQENYVKEDLEKIPTIKIAPSQPVEIEVKENEDCPKLKESNFKYFEHDLKFLKSESTSANSKVKFKLFLSNNAEINLYDHDTLTYLYSEDVDENNKLGVYYYGDDKRPFLLCYAGNAYKPKDLSSYFNSWIKIVNIEKCFCKDDGTLILSELKNILYFMYPVRLQQYPSRDENELKYTTHSFRNDTNNFYVTISVKADDMNCYRRYTHTSDNSASILGEISHNGMLLFSDYPDYENKTSQKNKFPSSVFVYFYLYDLAHGYPLLIVLNYDKNNDGSGNSSNNNQYYRLGGSDDSKWSKLIEPLNLDNKEELEKVLKKIKDDLGINYEKIEENLIISSSDNCHEGSVAGPVAGTMVTLGLAGGGIGLGYYFRPDLFTIFYRRLF